MNKNKNMENLKSDIEKNMTDETKTKTKRLSKRIQKKT